VPNVRPTCVCVAYRLVGIELPQVGCVAALLLCEVRRRGTRARWRVSAQSTQIGTEFLQILRSHVFCRLTLIHLVWRPLFGRRHLTQSLP